MPRYGNLATNASVIWRMTSSCRLLFHEPFEAREVMTERSGEQHRFDGGHGLERKIDNR